MLKILRVVFTNCCGQQVSSFSFPAFLIRFWLAAAIATMLVFARVRTAPDENSSHRKHDAQGEKLLPVHEANITAICRGANGILARQSS
jgi:hypothetical protein